MTTTESFAALAPASRLEVAAALAQTPDNRDARALRHAPYANRLISLQTAMVPPKVDGTSERVAEIVKGLAKQGAIYPDQMGAIHSDLLSRAYAWNSLGVQESIQALVNDVIHGQNRTLQDELGRTQEIANASLLTQFYTSLYKTVERGQRNFEAFKRLLRLFVNNVPTAEVYKTGPSFGLQVNLGGQSQNINLDNAFENLKEIWGARWDAVNNPRIGALLTPNTQALLFFTSAFYDYGMFEPGSYLDNLLRLYKETVRADVDAEGDVVMELKDAGVNLNRRFEEYKDTLNYLLQNRPKVPETGPLELSREQEELFRYLMRQLRRALKDGVPADVSVSTMAQYVDPRLYQTHKTFIEKLQNYLLMAQARNPGYYRAIVLDPQWRPPVGLYTDSYVIPEPVYADDFSSDADVLSGFQGLFDAPSRDENPYIDDEVFRPPPRRGLTAAQEDQLRRDIDDLTRAIDSDLGVQSEAGWLADHRLPQLFQGALNVGEVNPAQVPLPPDVEFRSRSSSLASEAADAIRRLNLSGQGGAGFFASLRPSVGTRRSSRPDLRPTAASAAPVRGSGLTRRVMHPRVAARGKRLRFY
ncbi:capsid protein precursor pIIIa [Pigeon adenovirus 1]|uniref:Capsid protein pIIIa n=1 Tax=Pigeon adenovirus 1 TaxID=764030 RepID=X5LRM1_9ADEN|nr:capsid protein precursor pIIIa [Pigeon adenovirus 1]CDO33899.1 capsid protein precursor pIIIa [Pigeon adenovirus 1]